MTFEGWICQLRHGHKWQISRWQAQGAHLIECREYGELGHYLDDCGVIGENVPHIAAKHKKGHHDNEVEAGASSQTEVS